MTIDSGLAQKSSITPPLRPLISRFPKPVRRELWQLTNLVPRFRDLLESFPAAAIATAVRTSRDPVRTEALRHVKYGAPLYALARTLELPLWYRRLPPEAFAARPAPMTADASDVPFGARILNHLPTEPCAWTGWLDLVERARLTGGDDFAVWLAAQRIVRAPGRPELPLHVLALYAWASRERETAAGRSIIGAWSASMSLPRAAFAARVWLLRVLHGQCMCEPAAIEAKRAWRVGDFKFVALQAPADILTEARAMHNCLADYIGLVAAARCRLYGVRLHGERVATLELRPGRSTGAPVIHQVCGPHNLPPAPEVVTAAQGWLSRERLSLGLEFRSFSKHTEERFAALVWAPYVEAAGRTGRRLPATAPPIAILLQDADTLAAICK